MIIQNRFLTRPYEIIDIHNVYALIEIVFKDSPLFLRETIDDFYGYEGILVYDSDDNNKIIGALLFTVVDKLCYLEYIGTIVQHCGIGTLMLNQFLNVIDQRNITGYLHVENAQDMHVLVNWYTKYGFKTQNLENVYPYFDEKVDALLMVRC